MPEVRVTVGSRIGLHARPAALLAKAAKGPLAVRIARVSGASVDAASMLAVMGLGVGAGEEVVLSADGDGAVTKLAELAELVARDLDAVESVSND